MDFYEVISALVFLWLGTLSWWGKSALNDLKKKDADQDERMDGHASMLMDQGKDVVQTQTNIINIDKTLTRIDQKLDDVIANRAATGS